jgi:hypothetical protein
MPARRFFLVVLAALLAYAPSIRHRNLKDCGGSSRMATVESLVERGTFAIDRSTFSYTCDRMALGGRTYSDKPPLLSVVAGGVYAVLHHGLGLHFRAGADPDRNQLHDPTYAWMTLLVTVVAQALLVATFDAAAGELGLAGGARLAATAAVAFATVLWPQTAIFSSHPVAAALLLGGWRLLWVRSPARAAPALAGFLLGLLVGVDIPAGVAALGLALLLGPARRSVLLGAVLPLALHAALNLTIVGDLKPFQMHRELYDETTGHAGASATGFAEDAGLGYYAVRNLFGSLGVFALTPVALLALALTSRRAFASRGRDRMAVASVVLFAALVLAYVVVWPEAVGCSYGMRHVAPALPPLLLTGAVAAAPNRRMWRGFVALALVSAVLAGGGILSPTTCAGFVTDARGYVPARVFFDNLRSELWPRLRDRRR